MGKFNKGVVFGGLLGAALVWLNTTSKGKQYRTKIVDQASDVYERVKQEIVESGAVDKLTKNAYVARVTRVVDKYAIENGLADNVKQTLVRLLGSQWSRLKRDIKQ